MISLNSEVDFVCEDADQKSKQVTRKMNRISSTFTKDGLFFLCFVCFCCYA
ncbi:hypothetical protein DNTS_006102 [Danionella cerebrum]|uniref:Uncharacterized protein n=1 Tax=Danionella cerebrum TaxID=2873325 RepID=A0A553QMG9_9TELE|nr:hypothetical protein DNTS_006102 [Danionella translucida]